MGTIAAWTAVALLLWLAVSVAALNRHSRALARQLAILEATLDERLGAIDASIWKIQEGQGERSSGSA